MVPVSEEKGKKTEEKLSNVGAFREHLASIAALLFTYENHVSSDKAELKHNNRHLHKPLSTRTKRVESDLLK